MVATAQSNWFVRIARGFAATVAGPIFVKELRVASRRRRSYLLRFAYLALLTVFVAITWASAINDPSSAMSSYQSADTGRSIVATIAIFQFFALNLIAIIVMSTSISDEVYHGTMGVLMTTPVSNLQVIAGKLASKLLQLAVLVILSVPLLSVVRVFGGVPWNYVLGTSCITLTACAFAGAVTLFYSVLLRRAYTTILASLGTVFFLYVVLWIILGLVEVILMAATGFSRNSPWASVLSLNPVAALFFMTFELGNPGVGGMGSFPWPVTCLLMLGLTAGISLLCVPMVRRVSLKRAMGGGGAPNVQLTIDNLQLKKPSPRRDEPIVNCKLSIAILPPPMPEEASGAVLAPPLPTAGVPAIRGATPHSQATPHRKPRRNENIIYRVKGSAIVWKETRGPWVFRGVWSLVSLVLCLSILALIDTLVGLLEVLPRPEYHAVIMAALTALTIAVVSVTSATTISTEKESRSLPVLLTTPMGDGHIIMGKFVGVLRRCIGSFIPMTGHLTFFVLVGLFVRKGFIHPVALPHMALILAPMLWFYISSGLYFGSKFKKTTAAVVLNLGLALGLLVLLPIVAGMADYGTRSLCFECNPVVQAVVMVSADGWPRGDSFAFAGGSGPYDWPSGNVSLWESTVKLLTWALVYFLAGSLFLWRARANLRKKLF